MERGITNKDAQDFLQDVKDNGKVEILHEGSKEVNDLIQSAKKRGILIEGSKDLGVLKTIYLFADVPNSNKAIVPSKEFKKIFPQIIGKPMNLDHNRKEIIGFYIDYKYILKENKAIAYAVFFKSNYPMLWEKAKDFQKKGKLSSSFELWSDNNKTEYLTNGDYKLRDISIAGGALILEEYGNKPAFKNAKVLSMSKKVNLKECIGAKCLVTASKYKQEDIIVAGDYFKDSVKENKKQLEEETRLKEEKTKEEVKPEVKKEEVKTEESPKVEDKKEVKTEPKIEKIEDKPKEEVKEEKKVEEPKVEKKEEDKPAIPKLKCSNCEIEFDYTGIDATTKCPKCFAIIDKAGKMIYPPQIKDFKIACPTCKTNNWLILARDDETIKTRCLSCSKEFNMGFEVKKEKIADRINFLYSSYVRCPQCSNSVPYAGVSSIEEASVKCGKCGLQFAFNIKKSAMNKKISKIEEIVPKEIKKSSEQGGKQTMELKPDAKKVEATTPKDLGESKEVAKEVKVVEKVEVKEQPKTEEIPKAKVEEPKVEETPKKAEAPKTEEKQGNDLVFSMKDKVEEVVIDADTDTTDNAEITVSEIEKVEPIDKYSKSKTLRKAVDKIKDVEIALTEANDESALRKSAIKKLVTKILKLKKEVKLYKANAKSIIERRAELGETELTDAELLNDDKFNLAKAEKENLDLKAKQLNTGNEIVGGKKHDGDYLTKRAKAIDAEAFKHVNKNKK